MALRPRVWEGKTRRRNEKSVSISIAGSLAANTVAEIATSSPNQKLEDYIMPTAAATAVDLLCGTSPFCIAVQ
jgi:hypothetical protein